MEKVVLCKDLKHSGAQISPPFKRLISLTPVTLIHQSVSLFGWQMFSYLLPSVLQNIVLICLKPSLSYSGIRLHICVLGAAWFETRMAATKLSTPTHVFGASSEQSAGLRQLRQQAQHPKGK